jgi:hypothetical protein
LDAELELIFLLAGCEERRSELQTRARTALARAEPGRLALTLARRRLLPLIGTRALALGPDLLPDTFRDAVTAAVAETRARALRVEAATLATIGKLEERGIPALALKGPLLAQAAYGDLGMRDTADVDVLVRREQIADGVRVLSEAGFEARETREPRGLPDLHYTLVHGELPPVDLHWRVHWYESAFSAALLERSELAADGMRHPREDDLAATLLLLYARDGFDGIRLAADVAGWWDRGGRRLPAAFLEGHARRYPELSVALTASAHLAQRLTGVPAVRWLGSAATQGRRVRIAARLADWAQVGSRDQRAANVSMLSGLLGPWRSLPDFVQRELRPETDSIPARVAHASKMCARYVIGLARTRRPGGLPRSQSR